MGPAATILLQQRVLDALDVTSDSGHIPLLIDMNPQVPSRISYLIHETGKNPGPVLAKMAQGLEASGVDALAMPCCTAHHFADEIAGAVSVPFLNMVKLTAAEIDEHTPKGAKVGILASPATDRIGLFKAALGAHGLATVFPKNANRMLSTIEAIKAEGVRPEHIEIVQSALEELVEAGAKALIVGCSEFSLISQNLKSDVPIIDAMDVLTKAIVKLWKSVR
jgi:aspartate racemase